MAKINVNLQQIHYSRLRNFLGIRTMISCSTDFFGGSFIAESSHISAFIISYQQINGRAKCFFKFQINNIYIKSDYYNQFLTADYVIETKLIYIKKGIDQMINIGMFNFLWSISMLVFF